MTLTRRMILAAVLSAGLAPAMAQVPPPVPALPDTERRTSYSISASTCACAIGFQLFGDSTDYGNWLEVFVNGVRMAQAGNWTISTASPGGLALAARPISDAVLTFVTAQTGTIQIVGARRPRRTTQFQESQPVPTRNFNQTFSDITATLREMWDKNNALTGRVVQAPAGETMNPLPPQANRANMGACFDSGGNLTPCVTAGGSFIPGNGIAFTGSGPTTITNNIQAGAGINISGANPLVISSTSTAVVTPSFTCDGVTDFGTQLQALITANAGKTISIPGGLDCLTSISLVLPSNTTITGAGREVSVIRSTTANPVFTALNQTNISLTNFWCKGSDAAVSWSVASYGCVKFQQNVSAVAAGTNYNIQNMKFSNFNQTYWNYFDAVGSTLALRNITFSNNYIVSASGDIPTDASASNNNNYGLVIFSGSAGGGRVENTLIKNNRYEATALCFPIVLYTNHYKFQITENMILNPANTSPIHCSNGDLSAQNSYGILVYDNNGDGNSAVDGVISLNTVIAPTSAGIYMVGDPFHNSSSNTLISNNSIDLQSSQDDSTLPRAGIVVSITTDVDISGNKLHNGFGGVAAASQQTGVINIHDNTCDTTVSSVSFTASCVRLGAGANGSSNTSKHIVKGNYLEMIDSTANGGSAIRALSTTGARFNDVEISDNTIRAGWIGLQFASQFVTGSAVIKNNRFGGVANNEMATISANTGSPIVVADNVFDSIAGASGNGLIAQSGVYHLANNKFINRASGSVAMLNMVGACGTIMGTQFNAVVQAAQVTATSLGTSNPSGCTLNYLDQVQNLTPSEFGSAASKYVVDHWSHIATTASTTHLEQRQLTGN